MYRQSAARFIAELDNGVMEYWSIGSETHHSTTPVLHHSGAG